MSMDSSDRESRVGAGGLVPASGVGGELDVIASQLIDAARAEGIALTGEGGLLPALLGRVLSAGLSAELTDHLGYERHAVDGHHSGNSRNGTYPKTVTTEIGEVEVAMPRDRAGSFDSMWAARSTMTTPVSPTSASGTCYVIPTRWTLPFELASAAAESPERTAVPGEIEGPRGSSGVFDEAR